MIFWDKKTVFDEVLSTYKTEQEGLYIVGTFDLGVTVYSQQIRALNLVWALIESGKLKCKGSIDTKPKIAIVGGGFSGTTLAAALIKKGVNAEITLLEKRDTLLPLQQGSDSRWIHPRIYDWPAIGSEMATAELPILNWVAGRASDVAVQVLREWERILKRFMPKKELEHSNTNKPQNPTSVQIYYNTRHLQVHGSPLRVEWIGDLREQYPEKLSATESRGVSETFQFIILTIGFGLERDKAFSYWRNETLAQPNLEKDCATYLVSGQGDGAIIDLLRIRIAAFRQDRILAELFENKNNIVLKLRNIYEEKNNNQKYDLFHELEKLYEVEFKELKGLLASRLRRDTQVILHTKVKKIADLFNERSIKVSFQNRVMLYFLYKCGGFIPSSAEIADITKEYSIPNNRIILRHGTLRDEVLEEILDPRFFSLLKKAHKKKPTKFYQTAITKWSGGYFDYIGSSEEAKNTPSNIKANWRKEYLPPSTELFASSFCSSVAGYLESLPNVHDLRVTLHRAITIGKEEVLQQTCRYQGNSKIDRMGGSGRTFPTTNGTIGFAFLKKKIVYTDANVVQHSLNDVMNQLRVNEASQKMSNDVLSIIAIPLLCNVLNLTNSKNKVFGILYIDSYSLGLFTTERIKTLITMSNKFIKEIERITAEKLDRISNYPHQNVTEQQDNYKQDYPELCTMEIERVTEKSLSLNFDYADFVMVQHE